MTGSAGGGLVTAVVNGSGDLLRIRIDPSVVDPADVETLEDLVIAAVHDARRAAEERRQQRDGIGRRRVSTCPRWGCRGLGFPGLGGRLDELDDDFDDDSTTTTTTMKTMTTRTTRSTRRAEAIDDREMPRRSSRLAASARGAPSCPDASTSDGEV